MVKTMGRPKGIDPPKANVASRVSQELYAWFEARADAEKRTVSQLVSFAMEEYRQRIEGTASDYAEGRPPTQNDGVRPARSKRRV